MKRVRYPAPGGTNERLTAGADDGQGPGAHGAFGGRSRGYEGYRTARRTEGTWGRCSASRPVSRSEPPHSPAAPGLVTLVAVGASSITANVLNFLASQRSLLTIAAVLSSLYPGVTVAMGALLLHELPDRGQPWGLLLGAVAVTAVVLA